VTGQATASVAARVIAAIGRADFPEQLLAVRRELRMARKLEEAGPTLAAAIRRHAELMEQREQTVLSHSRSVLLRRAREWGLSEREAEVATGLAMGQSQSDIAKASGLALNSVITYRRRAYQKLKVADRLELRALCDRLIPLVEP